jgi:hypothetical protein
MARNRPQYGRPTLGTMELSTPPPHPPRRPALAPRRRLSGAALGALALLALALACALSSRRSASPNAEHSPLSWHDGLRVRGPFGSSLGVGANLARAPGSRAPALRLRFALDLSPFGWGEP